MSFGVPVALFRSSKRPLPRGWILSWILAVLLIAGLAEPAAAAKRIALLIGNSHFADPALDLRNPGNDVRALDDALRDLGFTVTTLTDSSRAEMDNAIDAFAAELPGAEIGLFYFAGHGVQIDGVNYLLSSGVARPELQNILDQSVDVFRVRDAFNRGHPDLAMIILDACRDNPFRNQMPADARPAEPGLARERGDAGMLIAYATDPGNVASDGAGDHSRFMEGLLANLATPGLEVRLMLGRVRQYVITHTGGRQVPWVEESVLGEHFMKPGAAPAGQSADLAEAEHWKAISASLDPADYERHLQEFPDGLFAAVARQRLDRLRSGQSVTVANAGRIDNGTIEAMPPDDRRRLQLALQVLGFYDGPVSGDAGEETARALDAYLALSGSPTAELNQVVAEASRNLVLVGASVGLQISNDLIRLRAIDRAIDEVATPALQELEQRLAERHGPDDDQILADARAQVQQMQDLREQVQGRLDYTRTFYAELIDTAADGFPDQLALLSEGGAARAIEAEPALARLSTFADRFVRHALDAENPETRGSYRWLADYIQ